jgi:hypothetical protein
MVNIKVSDLTIGTHRFNQNKASYPSLPTVFSGVEITWGAESCIEHSEPTRAQLSLWVPKTHAECIPELGDVVTVKGGAEVSGSVSPVSIFTGKVESVTVQDDHVPYAYTAPVEVEKSPAEVLNGTWTIRYAIGGTKYDMEPYTTLANGVFSSTRAPGVTDNSIYDFFTPEFNVTSGAYIKLKTGIAGAIEVYVVESKANGTVVKAGFLEAVDGTLGVLLDPQTTKMYFGYTGRWTSGQTEVSAGPFSAVQMSANTVLADPPGYRINVTAADALAEGARLRLSSSPWGETDAEYRLYRIAEVAEKSGVDFAKYITINQGGAEALNVTVIERDVDSAPALELYQRTLMSIGHTAISANNVIQPSTKLKLPTVLDIDMTGVTTLYSWAGGAFASKSLKKVNGVTTRTNEARYPLPPTNVVAEYTTVAGTSGVVSPSGFSFMGMGAPGSMNGNTFSRMWSTSATGGSQGLLYTDLNTSGASGSRLSAGMWVAFTEDKNVRLVLTAYSGATPVGTVSGSIVAVPANTWILIKADGVTTTGAYTSVQALAQVQTSTNMQANQKAAIGSVIIEKTATVGAYFDGRTIDGAAKASVIDVVLDGVNPLPLFPANSVEDSTMTIDTSHVINQVKIDYTQTTWDGTDTAYVEKSVNVDDFVGSATTTPQQRSLATDIAVGVGDSIEVEFIYQKAEQLLVGQSTPQYRLSDGLKVVLKNLPEQVSLKYLLDEATRFGHLIKLTGQPELMSEHFRVKSGRIVLGENQALEFELEPVEYSAPTPMSSNTLSFDSVAYNLRIENFKTLSSNDLRTIGAR